MGIYGLHPEGFKAKQFHCPGKRPSQPFTINQAKIATISDHKKRRQHRIRLVLIFVADEEDDDEEEVDDEVVNLVHLDTDEEPVDDADVVHIFPTRSQHRQHSL